MQMMVLASDVWADFAVGYGVAAAILTIGGIVVLRFQRNRHEFALMRAALERGITSFQTGQPPWLVSLRQGMMILTLGIALAGVGAGAWWLADGVHLPEIAATQPSAELLTAPKLRDDQGRLRPEGRVQTIIKNQWERSQNQRAVGMAVAGAGVVLILLGAVRVSLARVEKALFDEVEGRNG